MREFFSCCCLHTVPSIEVEKFLLFLTGFLTLYKYFPLTSVSSSERAPAEFAVGEGLFMLPSALFGEMMGIVGGIRLADLSFFSIARRSLK